MVRVARAVRVERVAVATQADMLRDMQARERLDRPVRKGQLENIGAQAGQPFRPGLQGTVVHKHHRDYRAEQVDKDGLRADVHMLGRVLRRNPPHRPAVHIGIVRVNRGGASAIMQLRVGVTESQRFCTGQSSVRLPVRKVTGVGKQAVPYVNWIEDR